MRKLKKVNTGLESPLQYLHDHKIIFGPGQKFVVPRASSKKVCFSKCQNFHIPPKKVFLISPESTLNFVEFL